MSFILCSCVPLMGRSHAGPPVSQILKSDMSLVWGCVCVCVLTLNHVWLFKIPWTIACRDPLSTELCRQDYWNGLPFSLPEDLPDPAIGLSSLALAGGFFIPETSGKPTWYVTAAAAAKSLQSCPTLCDPIDCSPPGSHVPGILQARTLEWVAISFSNAWKWKVKVKSLIRVQLFATPWTVAHQAPQSVEFSRQEYW